MLPLIFCLESSLPKIEVVVSTIMQVNNFLLVEDLKLLANDEGTLCNLRRVTEEFSAVIVLELNAKKFVRAEAFEAVSFELQKMPTIIIRRRVKIPRCNTTPEDSSVHNNKKKVG